MLIYRALVAKSIYVYQKPSQHYLNNDKSVTTYAFALLNLQLVQ